MLYAVIMAGGSGTRFWPASRRTYPKQLLSIGTPRPLVEETVDRISGVIPPERILIVTNAAYAGMTAELLSEVPPENVVGEPAGRDTAACIGLAALMLMDRDPDAAMAVMPSDHVITPAERFCSSLKAAEACLEERGDALITFGIMPTFPATGYGYIKQGEALFEKRGVPFHAVEAFREKPERDQAERFIEEGGYAWNAGIFIWKAAVILDQIARFLPELHAGLMKLAPHVGAPDFDRSMAEVYPGLQKISIDLRLMEKSDTCVVAGVNYQWDDVGSWRALERLLQPDPKGNHVQGECVVLGGADNIVSAKGGMVGLVGVEGLIVVHTPDATLVCRKEDAEGVKKLVDALNEEYR